MKLPLGKSEIEAILPHRDPFLLLDEVTELEPNKRVVARKLVTDEDCAGHFPGNPITPGVILIETMGQVAVVAHGIYLYGLEHSRAEIARHLTVFSDGEAEFMHMVRPGDEVHIRSELIFFRRKKIRSRVELRLADGRVAATAVLSGVGAQS